MSFFGLFGGHKKKKEQPAKEQPVQASAAPQAAAPAGVPQDVMAAISAAVYVVMYGNESAAAKVEIKHPSLLWAQTGRLTLMQKNQDCF